MNDYLILVGSNSKLEGDVPTIISLLRDKMVLGRGSPQYPVDVIIALKQVKNGSSAEIISRKHAELFKSNGVRWMIRGLGAMNGLYLNDEKIENSVERELMEGDIIRFGGKMEGGNNLEYEFCSGLSSTGAMMKRKALHDSPVCDDANPSALCSANKEGDSCAKQLFSPSQDVVKAKKRRIANDKKLSDDNGECDDEVHNKHHDMFTSLADEAAHVHLMSLSGKDTDAASRASGKSKATGRSSSLLGTSHSSPSVGSARDSRSKPSNRDVGSSSGAPSGTERIARLTTVLRTTEASLAEVRAELAAKVEELQNVRATHAQELLAMELQDGARLRELEEAQKQLKKQKQAAAADMRQAQQVSASHLQQVGEQLQAKQKVIAKLESRLKGTSDELEQERKLRERAEATAKKAKEDARRTAVTTVARQAQSGGSSGGGNGGGGMGDTAGGCLIDCSMLSMSLQCLLCSRPLLDASVLSCSHGFCRSCIECHWSQQRKAAKHCPPSCPACDQPSGSAKTV